jgi:hypothetical protein
VTVLSLPQITLNHSSPHSTPSISLPQGRRSYLSEQDKLVLSWGIQQVRDIFLTPPLRDLTLGEVTPGPSVTGKNLLHWVRCLLDLSSLPLSLRPQIEKSSLTNSHWVGTASMGPSSPPLPTHLSDAATPADDFTEKINSFSSPTPPPSPHPLSSTLSAHTPPPPPTPSVLDSQFHVRGVKNLRVAGGPSPFLSLLSLSPHLHQTPQRSLSSPTAMFTPLW